MGMEDSQWPELTEDSQLLELTEDSQWPEHTELTEDFQPALCFDLSSDLAA